MVHVLLAAFLWHLPGQSYGHKLRLRLCQQLATELQGYLPPNSSIAGAASPSLSFCKVMWRCRALTVAPAELHG